MDQFFHEDNIVMKILSKVFDLIVLNLLTLICCIPIITIGDALTAMHYVLMYEIEEKDGDMIKPFFRAFRKNFMQATLLWMPLLGIASVVVSCLSLYSGSDEKNSEILTFIAITLGILASMVFLYAFPLLARYENSIPTTITNAIRLAISHIPQTGAMLALLVVYGKALSAFFQNMLPFLCLFGLTLPGWLFMKLYFPVLCKVENRD